MNFKYTLLLILLAGSAITVDYGFPEEDDVLVLTDSNFKEAIEKHEFVLVEFYAPWCGHCKKLTPEYAKAAAELKGLDSPVPLAKVDATENSNIAKEYGVQGYPTLKFFVKGSPIEYNGGRTHPEIVNWIKKKTGPPSAAVTDAAHLEELKKANKVLTVFLGKEDSAEYQAFKDAALSLDAVAFVHSHDEALLKAEGGWAVTVHTQHNGGYSRLTGEITKDSILKLIADNRFPLVMDFEGDEAIERVFGAEKPALVYFSDSDTDFLPAYNALAAEESSNSPAIIFFTSKVTSGLGQRLADYVGVAATATPALWIVHPANKDLSKFKFDGEYTTAGVKSFIANWRAGTLEKIFKSEEIPEKNDEPVKVVVGKNFDAIVKNSGKFVLLEFYAPWCGHCKSLVPIYEDLAKQHAGNDKLVIAKIDGTANEIPNVAVQGFPTIKFYIPGQAEPIDFSGDRTLEGFNAFLKEKLGDDFAEPSTDL
jgi:protein disulfide-isomerase A1